MESRGTEVQQDRHASRPSCASRRGEHLRTRPPSTFRLCLLAVLRRAPQRLAQTCTSASIKQIFWKLCKGDKWRRKKKNELEITAARRDQPPSLFSSTFSACLVAVGRCWIKPGLFPSVSIRVGLLWVRDAVGMLRAWTCCRLSGRKVDSSTGSHSVYVEKCCIFKDERRLYVVWIFCRYSDQVLRVSSLCRLLIFGLYVYCFQYFPDYPHMLSIFNLYICMNRGR